jgi:hypothetical protein
MASNQRNGLQPLLPATVVASLAFRQVMNMLPKSNWALLQQVHNCGPITMLLLSHHFTHLQAAERFAASNISMELHEVGSRTSEWSLQGLKLPMKPWRFVLGIVTFQILPCA